MTEAVNYMKYNLHVVLKTDMWHCVPIVYFTASYSGSNVVPFGSIYESWSLMKMSLGNYQYDNFVYIKRQVFSMN